MEKLFFKGILFLIISTAVFFVCLIWQTKSMGKCGMSAGPVYGTPIRIKRADLKLEQRIKIPNGALGLMNISDSLPPKLIKFDAHGKVIWAVEFREEPDVDIPHQKLSKMNLVNDKHGITLEFFNYSYSEPGRIYLTKNYELEYMCLSPM